MYSLSFAKVVPGGNPTIILTDPGIPAQSLPGIAAALMQPLHLGAEQVGALYGVVAATSEPPHLEMMGGEFCVNATRAAALILARQGRLAPLARNEPPLQNAGRQDLQTGDQCEGMVFSGEISVSGMDAPLAVQVCAHAESLALDGRMRAPGWGDGMRTPALVDKEGGSTLSQGTFPSGAFLSSSGRAAARVPFPAEGINCRPLDDGVVLVSMPGMQHLLLDANTHPVPDTGTGAWRSASAMWRKRFGLEDSPASGVVWRTDTAGGCRIWPAVAVRATNSEHMESACGSASLAAALWARQSSWDGLGAFSVLQPSGHALDVYLEGDGHSRPEAAWVSGPVFLAAEGRTFVSAQDR